MRMAVLDDSLLPDMGSQRHVGYVARVFAFCAHVAVQGSCDAVQFESDVAAIASHAAILICLAAGVICLT